VEEQEDIC